MDSPLFGIIYNILVTLLVFWWEIPGPLKLDYVYQTIAYVSQCVKKVKSDTLQEMCFMFFLYTYIQNWFLMSQEIQEQ